MASCSRSPVTLTRHQRDVLYRAVKLDLSGIGDISLMLSVWRGEAARELRDRYVDDMRLLDDLGWDRLDRRESYELTMPRDQLERTIRRHHELAVGSLEDQANFLRERRDPEETAEEWADIRAQAKLCADDDLDLMAVCEAVLAAMGAKPPGRRRAVHAA